MNQYKPEGMLVSSAKNREYTSSLGGLKLAYERQAIIESYVVMSDHNLNLIVEFCHGIKGIIPKNEVVYSENEAVKDIAILTRVGKPACFKITGFETDALGNTIAILSRRAAQSECHECYISTLIPGDIIPSRITHLENFGAFVDIGCGITSLLSIDTISISRIAHPSVRVGVGDFIYTVVKGRDDLGRIYVSERELLGSWEENASLFSVGETVTGVIRSVEEYGVFVELKPNLAGLAEYRADVKAGQIASVYIKSIIPDKMKIKLIIIDVNDGVREREPLDYFVDVSRSVHMDVWRYSPPSSKRVIESVFTERT
jgi:small subunit ribosomal protein S1